MSCWLKAVDSSRGKWTAANFGQKYVGKYSDRRRPFSWLGVGL